MADQDGKVIFQSDHVQSVEYIDETEASLAEADNNENNPPKIAKLFPVLFILFKSKNLFFPDNFRVVALLNCRDLKG